MQPSAATSTPTSVRPLAGAGIEILSAVFVIGKRQFAPSRGRELKYVLAGLHDVDLVRPLAGAGIEM